MTEHADDARPQFVVDIPNVTDDDAEGHISGAVNVDPRVPSAARDLTATHPKVGEDETTN